MEFDFRFQHFLRWKSIEANMFSRQLTILNGDSNFENDSQTFATAKFYNDANSTAPSTEKLVTGSKKFYLPTASTPTVAK